MNEFPKPTVDDFAGHGQAVVHHDGPITDVKLTVHAFSGADPFTRLVAPSGRTVQTGYRLGDLRAKGRYLTLDRPGGGQEVVDLSVYDSHDDDHRLMIEWSFKKQGHTKTPAEVERELKALGEQQRGMTMDEIRRQK